MATSGTRDGTPGSTPRRSSRQRSPKVWSNEDEGYGAGGTRSGSGNSSMSPLVLNSSFSSGGGEDFGRNSGGDGDEGDAVSEGGEEGDNDEFDLGSSGRTKKQGGGKKSAGPGQPASASARRAAPATAKLGSTRTLFRRPHEKEYLWVCLYDENPWQYSNDAERLEAWERAADAVATPGTITVLTADGEEDVEVEVLKDKEVISTTELAKKIKRLYLSSSADFKAQEAKHEGQTGEGTESAADWCAEDDRSEMLALEKLVQQAAASQEDRKKKPAVSREDAASAAATRDEAVEALAAAQGRRGRGRGARGRGGASGSGGVVVGTHPFHRRRGDELRVQPPPVEAVHA